MRMSQAFPSQWLTAGDLPDGGIEVTIRKYGFEEVGQDKQAKPVLHFEEKGVKPLILNKTNGRTIVAVLGTDEMDEWVGERITLVSREVEFQGDTVEAVRVAVPKKKTRAAVNAQAPVRKATEESVVDDSDIPF